MNKNEDINQLHFGKHANSTNSVRNQQLHSIVTLCGKCKLCPQMNTAKLFTNDKLNITEKIEGTGNFKEREIIYAAQCSQHKVLYIGHTEKQLSERFSKYSYDIKYRPDNSELAKHFHEGHNLNDDLNVTTLRSNIKAAAARKCHEDKWICKLKTLAPHGLSTEIGGYAKEMYNFYYFSNELFHKLQYYVHMIMKNMADFGLN